MLFNVTKNLRHNQKDFREILLDKPKDLMLDVVTYKFYVSHYNTKIKVYMTCGLKQQNLVILTPFVLSLVESIVILF